MSTTGLVPLVPSYREPRVAILNGVVTVATVVAPAEVNCGQSIRDSHQLTRRMTRSIELARNSRERRMSTATFTRISQRPVPS